ncbi:MAG TPA: site-2 protease family protein [Terriglobales bacterium]|nr:site-2 protease family protein [Terriglobales bacterium]
MSEIIPPLPSATAPGRPIEVFVLRPPRRRYWLHILLLLITLYTTLVVGARMEFNFLHHLPAFYTGDDSMALFPALWAMDRANLALGIPFAFTLMLILLAHEMGHYLYCLRYGVSATLPFFIPFPTLIGTLGAFIRIRSPIRSRAALFDIGIAGPIAGFLVSVVVLFFSLGLSHARTPLPADQSIAVGYPLIFHLMHGLMAAAGMLSGAAALPLDTVSLHPTAIAAWVGMFATALNLLPGGQLDGGHIIFSLAPGAHRVVSAMTILALLPLAYYRWVGWFLWALLLGLSGLRHPIVPLWPAVTGKRRWLALTALAMLILTWTPAPIRNSSVPEVIRQVRSGR